MKKCIPQQQRTAIEKQFIAFSCNIYTEFIFEAFLVVMREKMEIEWMKIFIWKFCVLLNGKINFPPTRIDAVRVSTLHASDTQCRFNSMEKYRKISTKSFFPAESNFSSLKMFYSATENEHLTNWDRIQWQLTQFVNQFPLHALNINSLLLWLNEASRHVWDVVGWNGGQNNCCFSPSHQYFISLPGPIVRRCHKFGFPFF